MADIDIVVPWVDGSDPAWQTEKALYSGETAGDSRNIRYRDWDTLRYWFRGVERFAPWARKVHFVTWGHIPPWLNTDNERLHIVRHSDYIPQEYLPTFSSHTIELNLHRIEGLAEQFVYFNDDTFLVGPIPETWWFRDGLPCDQGIIGPYVADFRGSIAGIACNDTEIINSHFKRGEVMRQKPLNWFNPKYGKLNLFNLAGLMWQSFTGFMYEHFPNAYLRSTYETLWALEYDVLHATSLRKFRDKRDVNQYVMRDWQLASNQFVPRRQRGYASAFTGDSDETIRQCVLSGKNRVFCLNDCTWVTDIDAKSRTIHSAFRELLPDKCSFEL